MKVSEPGWASLRYILKLLLASVEHNHSVLFIIYSPHDRLW
jgi:hypothetical protein